MSIPRHVAIVMDGNGRWARARRLPRAAGHERGVERIHEVALACARRGVEYLSLYAFSTENWNRPRREVDGLLRLLSALMDRDVKTYVQDNLRLRLVGTVERLDRAFQEKVQAAIDLTRDNTGLTVCIAFDYGSRDEITRAARELAAGGIRPEQVTEEVVSQHLLTAGMPDVDLLVRCGGEIRLSNFLLWQSAYAELYFTEVLWPDFGEKELDMALDEFARRSRRFGSLDSGGSS